MPNDDLRYPTIKGAFEVVKHLGVDLLNVTVGDEIGMALPVLEDLRRNGIPQ